MLTFSCDFCDGYFSLLRIVTASVFLLNLLFLIYIFFVN